MSSIWNGANYYVYKFAKHQHLALNQNDTPQDKEEVKEPWYHKWVRRGDPSPKNEKVGKTEKSKKEE